MPETSRPQRTITARDLGAPCDRALARAALLARDWPSELAVTHRVHAAQVAAHDRLTSGKPSWHRPASWTRTRERALRATLAAEGIAATSRVVIGTAADAVLQGAADDGADPVVLGVAKDVWMDRLQLGSTIDALVRRSRVPVLNVRRRARSACHQVVVATDFSAPARRALRLAAHRFEGDRLTRFHADIPPGSALTRGPVESASWGAAMTPACTLHPSAAALAAPVEVALHRVLEQGTPDALLADDEVSADVDVAVLGSQGRRVAAVWRGHCSAARQRTHGARRTVTRWPCAVADARRSPGLGPGSRSHREND